MVFFAKSMSDITELISDDAASISEFVLNTPIVRLPWLDAPGRKVWAKLESKQLTNSFKVRGAFNAVRKLPPTIPVVTASAGNHGLAIAYVAEKLGRKSRIFVPANASELKLRRLIGMGAEVVPVGRDLFEATKAAQAYAQEIGAAFISPYSHTDVILGQGSIAVELLEQFHDPLDEILIPLGGGGLLAGVGSVLRQRSKETKIVALHPAAFERDFARTGADALSKPIFPTVADGLAVQHDGDALGPFVLSLPDVVTMVDEPSIETAIVAMLHNEGLLVEGAGAIGVAALMNDPGGLEHRGSVMLLICGGNIAVPSVLQALAVRADDARLARLVGHQSVQLPAEAARFRSGRDDTDNGRHSESTGTTGQEIWRPLISNLMEDVLGFENDLDRHEEFAVAQKLDIDAASIGFVREQLCSLKAFIAGYTEHNDGNPDQFRTAYRVAVQSFSQLRNALAWCSASVDQSRSIMFFDPAENSHSGVNYDRYGSVLLRERELSLVRSLGYDPEEVDLLLTSSGQAAYSVVESFLLREVLSRRPTVVAAPYLYFEAAEQIAALKHVTFVQSESWDLGSLIELAESRDADVVMLDPLANLGSLHVVDFRDLRHRLAGRDWSKKWLVVDGTMTSGGIDLVSLFDEPHHPSVLYYESGSKYLQFGLDLQMAGIVVARKAHAPVLSHHRRNLGAVMYQTGVTRFPRYERSHFLARMQRLTANAELLARSLRRFPNATDRFEISYPMQWRELGWAHGGGVLSLAMRDPGLNNRGCLDFLIDRIMHECRQAHVALTKGVSFGFSTTRVSAAAAMANDMPPFLRFSIGEEDEQTMSVIAVATMRALDRFFDVFSSPVARGHPATAAQLTTDQRGPRL